MDQRIDDFMIVAMRITAPILVNRERSVKTEIPYRKPDDEGESQYPYSEDDAGVSDQLQQKAQQRFSDVSTRKTPQHREGRRTGTRECRCGPDWKRQQSSFVQHASIVAPKARYLQLESRRSDRLQPLHSADRRSCGWKRDRFRRQLIAFQRQTSSEALTMPFR